MQYTLFVKYCNNKSSVDLCVYSALYGYRHHQTHLLSFYGLKTSHLRQEKGVLLFVESGDGNLQLREIRCDRRGSELDLLYIRKKHQSINELEFGVTLNRPRNQEMSIFSSCGDGGSSDGINKADE